MPPYHVVQRFNGGPDNCPAKHFHQEESSTGPLGFNGGPDNCPAKPPTSQPGTSSAPTFNGGPDNCPAKLGDPGRGRGRGTQGFNGGPDNCPAKPDHLAVEFDQATVLQWRAGQLPGQTRTGDGDVRHRHHASMEGRTIARPNLRPRPASTMRLGGFNGGPDNCPAKRRSSCTRRRVCRTCFNGGPDNCPAKPHPQAVT